VKGTSRSLRGDHCLLGCHQTTPVASQCQCSRIAAPRAICRRLTRHVKSCIGPSGLVSTLRWLQGWASLGLVKLFFDWDWRGRVVRAVTENEYTCDRGIASDTAIPYRETRPERSHARWRGLRGMRPIGFPQVRRFWIPSAANGRCTYVTLFLRSCHLWRTSHISSGEPNPRR